MKKYLILSLAALALLSGCEKDNDGDATTFTATIEQSGDKTTLGTSGTNIRKVIWESGDAICINGTVYTTENTLTTTATFTTTSSTALTSPYRAYYPAAYYSENTMHLPDTQTYGSISTSNSVNISNLPMYAQSTGHNLVFKNLCGVLAITVPSSQMTTVSSITVYSNKQMNGAINVNYDDNTGVPSVSFSSPQTDYAHKTVTLNMNPYVSISSGSKTFYIAVPAQNYDTLAIIVAGLQYNVSTSRIITAKIMQSTASSPMVVQRNYIYPITFGSATTTAIRGTASVTSTSGRNSCEWVRLWDGGPCFATFNVGATISDYGNTFSGTTSDDHTVYDYDPKYITENVGGMYNWGGRDNKRVNAESTFYCDSDVLPAEYDIATYLWGSNWKMPESSDLSNLLSNCTRTEYYSDNYYPGTNGFHGNLYTGKGAYAYNHIFLPAAGFQTNCFWHTGSNGNYWSSTSYTGEFSYWGYAYYLYFINGNQDVNHNFNRTYGCSVRAILN